MKLAIVSITKNGSALGRKLRDAYPDSVCLYMPMRFIAKGEKDVHALKDDIAAEVGRLFRKHDSLAFIMATGVVVRLIAPLLKDKRTDPAVVVLDEKGNYVISLLSGHIGGANELAKAVAKCIGAKPVITTASDVQGTLAVDTIAMRLDCAVEDFEAAKKVTAAIVNGEDVAVYSYAGKSSFKGALSNKLPSNLSLHDTPEAAWNSGASTAIVISPCIFPKSALNGLSAVAFLRPKTLVVGMGCNRGTSMMELEKLFLGTLKVKRLSPLSVKNIATITDKRDEAGINSLARKYGLKVKYIGRDRLNKAETPSGPSEAVYKNMGVYGVCEPAALLSAGAKQLLVPKRKSKNATIAVAEAALP